MTGNWYLKTSLGSEISFNQVYMKPFSNSLTSFGPHKSSYQFPNPWFTNPDHFKWENIRNPRQSTCQCYHKRKIELYQKGKSERFKASGDDQPLLGLKVRRSWARECWWLLEAGNDPGWKPVKKWGPQSNKSMKLKSAKNWVHP